jgi:MFS family permease
MREANNMAQSVAAMPAPGMTERRRNVGLVGISAAHAVNHMYGALLPLIYPLLLVQFHFGYAMLGAIIAASNVTGGLMQAGFGYINRRVSARTLIGWENIALGVCAAAMAITGNTFEFAAVRVAGAVAGSPQHPVGSAYCAEEFPPERRGFALGAHVGGGNIGTLLVPLLGALSIEKLGWRPTVLIFAIPIALMGILTFFLLQPDASIEARRLQPQDAGVKIELRNMLRRRNIRLVLLASTVAAGGRGLGVVMTYIPAYLEDAHRGLHLGQLTTGVLFNILLVGSVVGTMAAGRISDRFGRKRTLLVAYGLAFIAMLLVVVSGGNLLFLFPVLLFVGLTAFAESPLLQSFFADSIGGGSHRIGFGLYFTIAYGIGALWAEIIGATVEHFGFHVAFMVMGFSYLAAAAILLPSTNETSRGDPA